MRRLLMRAATACAVTTLIVTGGVAPAGAVTTGSPAPVTKIVYADQSGGIWIVNADGTGSREISTATADGVSFSPDGQRVAYATTGGVWTIPAIGGAARQLTPSGPRVFDVAWSPNGRWIAYTVEAHDLNEDIYRIPFGGGAPQRLTYGAKSGCDDRTPAWSPDSATIAYIRVGGCNGAGLVVQPIGQTGHTVVPGFAQSPSFTPVGNVVYISTCDIPGYCDDSPVSYEANADGSAPLLIDHRDDCVEGDLCQTGIIGAAQEHGWVQELAYVAPDNSSFGTCFRSGYQKAGTVVDMPPSFCLDNVLTNGYDVA